MDNNKKISNKMVVNSKAVVTGLVALSLTLGSVALFSDTNKRSIQLNETINDFVYNNAEYVEYIKEQENVINESSASEQSKVEDLRSLHGYAEKRKILDKYAEEELKEDYYNENTAIAIESLIGSIALGMGLASVVAMKSEIQENGLMVEKQEKENDDKEME